MKAKLKCIKAVSWNSFDSKLKDFLVEHKAGELVNALLDESGVSLQDPNGVYSFPFRFETIEKYFELCNKD